MIKAIHSKSITYGLLRALGLIFGVFILLWFLWEIQSVLAYIGIAAVVSLIGRPIVLFLKDRLKFHNTIAVILTLLLLFMIIIGAVLMVIPIITEQSDNLSKIDLEELELELIDFGVEELFFDEKDEDDNNSIDGIMIYGEFQNYGALQKALEEMNIEILSSDFEYIPTIQKEVTTEQRQDVDKLLEKLDEDDDVNNVYTTMQEEE